MEFRFRLNPLSFVSSLFGLLLYSTIVSAQPSTDQFITISPDSELEENTVQEVVWSIEPSENGLQCSIDTFFEKPEEHPGLQGTLGWGYRVEIDGITILNESLPDTERAISTLIPVSRIPDGSHTIHLVIQDLAGKRHNLKKEFQVNGSPRISAVLQEDNRGTFDPVITLSFMGERERQVGMVEIFVDSLFIKTVNITNDQNNKPIKFSDLIGRKIYTGDLAPGNHLVFIKADGLNGSSSLHSIPLIGSMIPPRITINQSSNSKLENIGILFPASSKPIVGSAEIQYNRSTILSVRTDLTSLSITRADILAAFETHNLSTTNQPIVLLLSTKSANHVENWQVFNFQ